MKKFLLILIITMCGYTSIGQIKANLNPSFNQFWVTFQKNLNVKTYLLSNINFPYFYSCNYMDPGFITKEQFQEQGVEIFMNGNAFISKNFSLKYSPPGSKSVKVYTNQYMDEYLKDSFQKAFGNLNGIYVISEKGNEKQQIGYKAYFKLIHGSYKFIGFEGQEEGD